MPASFSNSNGASLKEKSPIVSELLKAGFAKGSPEYKKAYIKEWLNRNQDRLRILRRDSQRRKRQNPEFLANERLKWKRYKEKKLKEDPNWESRRMKGWRKANPEKWAEIAHRASMNGLHRRWYANHREKKLKSARAIYERKNPLHGIKQSIAAAKRGELSVEELVERCGRALGRMHEGSNEDRKEREVSGSSMPVRL